MQERKLRGVFTTTLEATDGSTIKDHIQHFRGTWTSIRQLMDKWHRDGYHIQERKLYDYQALTIDATKPTDNGNILRKHIYVKTQSQRIRADLDNAVALYNEVHHNIIPA